MSKACSIVTPLFVHGIDYYYFISHSFALYNRTSILFLHIKRLRSHSCLVCLGYLLVSSELLDVTLYICTIYGMICLFLGSKKAA